MKFSGEENTFERFLMICSYVAFQKAKPIFAEIPIPTGKCAEGFPFVLGGENYVMLAMQGERTGFLCLEVECNADTELYLTFDEILQEGQIDFCRLQCANVVTYSLAGGRRYSLLTAEPYSLQYLNLISVGGPITVYRCGMVRVDFNASEI